MAPLIAPIELPAITSKTFSSLFLICLEIQSYNTLYTPASYDLPIPYRKASMDDRIEYALQQ